MINAGKYNKRIKIYETEYLKDDAGFQAPHKSTVLETYAAVKTTRGYTLIKNGTDFEKAYTNFTIRKPKTQITRDMQIEYKDKTYTIEYISDIDENGVELEIQAKEVTH